MIYKAIKMREYDEYSKTKPFRMFLYLCFVENMNLEIYRETDSDKLKI